MTNSPTDKLTFAAVGQSLIGHDIRNDESAEFQAIADILRGADVAFSNFEGTIEGRHGGWPTKDAFVHVGKPVVLDALRDMGITALSLANNHAFDLGSAGILSTIEEAKARGFLIAGTGKDRAHAANPGIADTPKGKVALVAMDCSNLPDSVYALDTGAHRPARPGVNRQRVISSLRVDNETFGRLVELSAKAGNEARKEGRVKVGYQEADRRGVLDFYGARIERADRLAEGRSLYPEDREKNLAAIRAGAAQGAFTIAYVHHHYWEPEWETTPDWIQEFARDCIDAGADAFVSHGVPLLQGIEIHNRRPIFYSLGNFIFHTHRAPKYTDDRIWQSVVAVCSFDAHRCLTDLRLVPIAMGGEQAMADRTFGIPRDAPRRVGTAYGTDILERVKRLSAHFGTDIALVNGEGRLRLG